MKRIDALKLLCQLMYEVPEDPAWEYLMERSGVEPDEMIDEFPMYPGMLDVYEALEVTPEEINIIEPHLNQIIKDEFKERYDIKHNPSARLKYPEGFVEQPEPGPNFHD
mgnify:CR=1 FL=1